MHKGVMTSLSLYPTKYLIDLFVPYGSFLETNIFSKSMSYILNFFFCLFMYFVKTYFFNYLKSKID